MFLIDLITAPRKSVLNSIFTILIMMISLSSTCQGKVFAYQNNSVLSDLKSYLKQDLQLDTNDFFIIIESITSKYSYPFEDKKINLINGIYDVRTGISHSPQYLLIKENNTFKIITNYSMKNLKEEYLRFFKNQNYSCYVKLKCIEDIIDIYNGRIELSKSQNE